MVEDKTTGDITAFHFYAGVVTQAQLDALATLRDRAGDYRAFFIRGRDGFDPSDPELDQHLPQGKLRTMALDGLIGEYQPTLQWLKPVNGHWRSWSLDYQGTGKKLTIRHEHGKNPEAGDLYTPHRIDCPFARADPAQSWVAKFQQSIQGVLAQANTGRA